MVAVASLLSESDLEESQCSPAHTSPVLVLSPLSPILHGQSGAEGSGLTLILGGEGRGEFIMEESSASFDFIC